MPQLNPTANITAGNVIVGFANFFVAPLGSAAPAPTKALGAVWPTGWAQVGATLEGVTVGWDPKTQDINVEEQMTPLMVLADTLDFTMSLTLSEDTVTNMLTAYGSGAIAYTATTTTLPGYSVLTLSNNINQVMVGLEAMAPSTGAARLIVVPIAVMAAKVDTVYRRAKAQRSYMVTARALCPVSSILIYEQGTATGI